MSYQGADRIAARYHVGGHHRGADGLLKDGELAGTFGTKIAAVEAARNYVRPGGYALADVHDTMARGQELRLVFTVELRVDGSRVETFGKVLTSWVETAAARGSSSSSRRVQQRYARKRRRLEAGGGS